MPTWTEHQDWEKTWHGNCVNSLNEQLKQLVYARKMGLRLSPTNKTPYNIDAQGKSIVDIGGGPYSLLLLASDYNKAMVVDPCEYPNWVYHRYIAAGIGCLQIPAEDFVHSKTVYDECWIYNVLQHVQDPQTIINNALAASKTIRLFEWVETGTTMGHPNNLHSAELDIWLGGHGKEEFVNEGGCVGLCYYGIFKGKHYEE